MIALNVVTVSHNWDLIVIGGGAAGLWAAGTAAQRGRKVLVLEKNKKAGVKILMSGGTRCNITHHCGIDGILQAFGKQGRFLKPSLHELPPAQVVEEFNKLGVNTKVEGSGKVFPVSNRAIDVRDALLHRLANSGGQIRTGVAVQDLKCLAPAPGIETEYSGWEVATETDSLTTQNVLLCCGGLSFPGCGTTGDGYAWAKKVGHNIVATTPALTPLLSPASWVHQLSGITLPDVIAQVVVPGQKLKDPRNASRGGFLWTHFGCSGPVPMNVSRFVSGLEDESKASLRVDLIPEVEEASLTTLFDPSREGRKLVAKLLQEWLPRSFVLSLLTHASVDLEVKLAELPKKGRQSLIRSLKELVVPLSGTRGYPKAEVTAGGVKTSEVNPQTMESRLARGLFLAGEILDIDGPIGGYNFQAAWSTGHAAGRSV